MIAGRQAGHLLPGQPGPELITGGGTESDSLLSDHALLSKHLLLATTAKPCMLPQIKSDDVSTHRKLRARGDGGKRGLWGLLKVWERT